MKRLLMVVIAALLAAGLLTIASCTSKKTVTQPEAQAQTGAQQADQQRAEVKEPARATAPRETITEKESKGTKQAETQAAITEIPAKIQDIHFDFDKYDVREDAQPILKELATLLSRNKTAKVIIEGHGDNRGTNEYNLALGDKRATSAKSYLASLGIPSSRIETVSYGEEKPLCKEETEACWAQNRRAHFVLAEERR